MRFSQRKATAWIESIFFLHQTEIILSLSFYQASKAIEKHFVALLCSTFYVSWFLYRFLLLRPNSVTVNIQTHPWPSGYIFVLKAFFRSKLKRKAKLYYFKLSTIIQQDNMGWDTKVTKSRNYPHKKKKKISLRSILYVYSTLVTVNYSHSVDMNEQINTPFTAHTNKISFCFYQTVYGLHVSALLDLQKFFCLLLFTNNSHQHIKGLVHPTNSTFY